MADMETMDTYPILRGKPGTYDESLDFYDTSVNVDDDDDQGGDELDEQSFNVYECGRWFSTVVHDPLLYA